MGGGGGARSKRKKSSIANITVKGESSVPEMPLLRVKVSLNGRLIEFKFLQCEAELPPLGPGEGEGNETTKTAMVLVFLEDVTQAAYMRRLQELNNYKKKMLSSISHELKTPLNCSIGMLEQLSQFLEQKDFFQTENALETTMNLLEPA